MTTVTAQLVDSARAMDTRESYEQTCNTEDWAAAEEVLTSAEMTARKDEDQGGHCEESHYVYF